MTDKLATRSRPSAVWMAVRGHDGRVRMEMSWSVPPPAVAPVVPDALPQPVSAPAA